MDLTINTRDYDYFGTISVQEDVRTHEMTGRSGRWLNELEEEFRSQRMEFDSLFDSADDV